VEITEQQAVDMAFSMAFGNLSQRIHDNAKNKGFWTGPENNNIGTKVALIHAELSEFLEAVRVPELLPDKHCPSHSNAEIELADVVIRTMDLAEHLGFDLSQAILAKCKANLARPKMHGGKLF
jgi:NTP pyrophosphatase (non-canonical NTP hydrolase)